METGSGQGPAPLPAVVDNDDDDEDDRDMDDGLLLLHTQSIDYIITRFISGYWYFFHRSQSMSGTCIYIFTSVTAIPFRLFLFVFKHVSQN